MASRTVAVKLKIPDNEAYTALTALRRLGINLAKLERVEVWAFEDSGAESDFVARVERNETLFNPNKHELAVLASAKPQSGEAWVEELGAHDEVRGHLGGKGIAGITKARRYVGWRLFKAPNVPADTAIVENAIAQLLCNPAIERAIIG